MTEFLNIPSDRTDLVILFTAVLIFTIFMLLIMLIQIVRKKMSAIIASGLVFLMGAILLVMMYVLFSDGTVPSKAEIEANKATVSETEDKSDTKEDLTYTEKDLTYVSTEAEMVLMQIAEDSAAQIAQNPSTVKFSTFEWGFSRNGHIYAVQGTFSCSNLMGVSETHVLQVWCEASEDYSKIKSYKVVLDDKELEMNN